MAGAPGPDPPTNRPSEPRKLGILKYAALAAVTLIGMGVLAFVAYAYLAMDGGSRTPDISEVDTSEMVARADNGEFLDAQAEVHPDQTAAQLGYLAPDFTLSDFDGHDVALSQFRGTPVLLNFWGTWCAPCRAEMPALQNFHEQYGDRVAIVGINWDHEVSDARQFLDSLGITYTNLIDAQGKMFVQYGLTALPTSFWIDERGVIMGYWNGAMDEEDMLRGFQKTTDVLDGESQQPP